MCHYFSTKPSDYIDPDHEYWKGNQRFFFDSHILDLLIEILNSNKDNSVEDTINRKWDKWQNQK